MKLFREPFDLDEIERALHADAFMSLAHLSVGREENWRVGLDQVSRLLPLFEESGRDYMPIYAVASMLVQRAGQLPEPTKRIEEATTKLGMLPRVSSLPSTQCEGGK
jgi:hypothetical protein